MKKIIIKLICYLILAMSIFVSGCITEENQINDKDNIGSTPDQDNLIVSPSTKTPTATAPHPIEEGVSTFKIGSWKVFSKDTTPKISIRFSTSETVAIDLIGPDGIPTDSVKYELIRKPSKMVGETVNLKLGDPLIIPQTGTYKLTATQNEKVVFTKEFVFKGPDVEVTKWEPHYKKSADGKLKIDYLNIYMKNNGDLPIYFKAIKRLIVGGEKKMSGHIAYMADVRIEPNTEIMIFSSGESNMFERYPEVGMSDELTFWIEDTSGNVHKFSTTVDPLKYSD
jgi:hypothetical protein